MLDLRISLHPTLAGSQRGVMVSDDTTTWGDPNPERAASALVLAAEWLSPATNLSVPVLVAYDPLTFTAPGGGDVYLPLDRDGLLRVVVAAVPVLTSAEAAALPDGTAYVSTLASIPKVRRSGLLIDPPLLPADILGETATGQPLVLAYTAAYYLSNAGLADALARLNLRYLMLPYQQQHALVALYERAALYQTGVQELYNQGRYLDAVATLEAAQYLLSSGGQNPDDFGPVLGGALPYTPI